MLRAQPELVTMCLRYAAGFATNPRYGRSALVMSLQAPLINLYAHDAFARRALTEQFRGRLAWQQWRAGDKSAKSKTLDHYMKALELYDKGAQGLDAEAPIHFFPELVTLLGQTKTRGEREKATLVAVDFITQRNYGIYFDIEKEKQLIALGLTEFEVRQTDLANNPNPSRSPDYRACLKLMQEITKTRGK